jgi:hypothetical protein
MNSRRRLPVIVVVEADIAGLLRRVGFVYVQGKLAQLVVWLFGHIACLLGGVLAGYLDVHLAHDRPPEYRNASRAGNPAYLPRGQCLSQGQYLSRSQSARASPAWVYPVRPG